MEPKKGHALRRTVITEDQIRQCREISDEIHSHEVVELVALLSDDVRRKVVLALFAQEIGLAPLPRTPDYLIPLLGRRQPRLP
ncbi:MAG: hypothetical protein ACYC22_13195 [Thiomonas delicata]|jgi:hypothetical protein